MPRSLVATHSRRASTRLITLVALAAVAAGAFYFVGTGDEEGGEEPARPTKKRAKRPPAEKVATASVSEPKATALSDTTKPAQTQEAKSILNVETPPPSPAPQPVKSEASPHDPITVEIADESAPAPAATLPVGPAPNPLPSSTPTIPSPATIPAKIARYAEKLLQKNDRDGSGRLEFGEWRQLTGIPQETDADGDGSLSADELTQFVAGYGRSRRLRLVADADPNPAAVPAPVDGQTSIRPDEKGSEADKKSATPRRDRKFYVNSKRVPQGLPDWFLERDADGDAQLTPAEFSPMSVRADLEEFGKLDLNSDGLLTADEYVRASTAKPVAEKTSGSGTNSTSPVAK